MTKNEIREVWIDQIKTAKFMADRAIAENPSDNGTCNFDVAIIKKEKKFSYDETVQMFETCGLPARKYDKGWLRVGGIHGQAERNTLWAKTFAFWMEEQGFKASVHYQVD